MKDGGRGKGVRREEGEQARNEIKREVLRRGEDKHKKGRRDGVKRDRRQRCGDSG